MPKPKALDLAGWRRTQTEPDPRGGTRQLTQRELARRIGIAHETLCRFESGARWPSDAMWDRICTVLPLVDFPVGLRLAQAATWRAFSPDRKGKRP